MSPIQDPFEYDTHEVRRFVWNAFATLSKMSKAKNAGEYFNLLGLGDSVAGLTTKAILDAGLSKAQRLLPNNESVKHAVLKVYQTVMGMGLILPSCLNQAFDWNNQNAIFHFTAEGIQYFSGNNFVTPDDQGYMSEVLLELQKRIPAIQDGQIELLLEAQRCVMSGCYRAAMVVVGVANEDLCIELLDAIPANCNAPSTGSALHNDWQQSMNSTVSFAARWKPGIRILEEVKKKVRLKAKGQPWAKWWEMVPGSLYTVGEAVRLSRNAAAHESKREFSKPEVALLLAAMPTQMEMIASLTEFLADMPDEVKPIQL